MDKIQITDFRLREDTYFVPSAKDSDVSQILKDQLFENITYNIELIEKNPQKRISEKEILPNYKKALKNIDHQLKRKGQTTPETRYLLEKFKEMLELDIKNNDVVDMAIVPFEDVVKMANDITAFINTSIVRANAKALEEAWLDLLW